MHCFFSTESPKKLTQFIVLCKKFLRFVEKSNLIVKSIKPDVLLTKI